jgi:hypothetical protein
MAMPKAGNGLRQRVARDPNGRDGDSGMAPEIVFKQKVCRHDGWDDSAADVHSKHGAWPLHDVRNGVAHPEKIDVAAYQDVLLRELRDRDVEIAADEGAKEQDESGS